MTLKLNGSTGGSVSIDAPANTNPSGSDVTLTLPVDDGTDGQVLKTNGSGALSWTANSGGLVQVKNVHWTGNVQQQVASSQYSLNVWEYDDANLRVSITPTSTDNRILVLANLTLGSENGVGIYVRLYRRLASGTGVSIGQPAASGSRQTCIAQIQDVNNNQSEASFVSVNYYDTPANTTDEHTYYFGFFHPSSSTRWMMINRTYDNHDNYYHAISSSNITLMEVAG